jgi:hypothetical protein
VKLPVRRSLCAFLILATALLAGACSTQRAFTYPLSPIAVVNADPPDVRIAVLPANDLRGSSNNWATYLMYMIPLMPFGWVNYERPEAASMFNTIREFDANLTEDIPKAIAQHLQRAGYARDVFFDYGANAPSADYTLETDLRETRYEGKIYSYGLSVFGPLLWLIGLPAGSSHVTLTLDLRLKDAAGQDVWTQVLHAREGRVQGLYYGWGRDMEGLARALQGSLGRLVGDTRPRGTE